MLWKILPGRRMNLNQGSRNMTLTGFQNYYNPKQFYVSYFSLSLNGNVYEVVQCLPKLYVQCLSQIILALVASLQNGTQLVVPNAIME